MILDNNVRMIEQQQALVEQRVDPDENRTHAVTNNMETHAVRMRLISRAVVERRLIKRDHAVGQLSVIVQPHDDSRDTELLSPVKLSPSSVSVETMIDSADYRSLQPEPTYQTLTSVNGRLSPPGYSPNSSYATLTPLQPLPPISTMSEKFAYGHPNNVSGSFTVMQNNGLGLGMGIGSVNVNSYTMPNINISPPHNYSSPSMGIQQQQQQTSPISPQSVYSQNGLPSPQKSMSPTNYDSPYAPQREIANRQIQSPNLSPASTTLNSPVGTVVTTFSSATLNGITLHHNSGTLVQLVPAHHRECSSSPPCLTLQQVPQLQHQRQQQQQQQQSQQQQQQQQSQQPQQQQPAPPPPPPPQQSQHQTQHHSQQSTHHQQMQTKSVTPNNSLTVTTITTDVEEINTKELAQRISAELKRYSIPQAIFAQRVLCRSQGTLSDLLRNPKPWSKLKSGRETFRRMWKWLQEPEFQRMSALRLAGSSNDPTSQSTYK